MQDLLEVTFGEIQSPSELQARASFEKLPDGRSQVDARMPLDEFNRAFGQKLVAENVETIGGFILDRQGVLPAEGALISLGKLEFKVLEINHNRIESLAVRKADKRKASAKASAEDVDRESTPSTGAEVREQQPRESSSPAEEK